MPEIISLTPITLNERDYMVQRSVRPVYGQIHVEWAVYEQIPGILEGFYATTERINGRLYGRIASYYDEELFAEFPHLSAERREVLRWYYEAQLALEQQIVRLAHPELDGHLIMVEP